MVPVEVCYCFFSLSHQTNSMIFCWCHSIDNSIELSNERTNDRFAFHFHLWNFHSSSKCCNEMDGETAHTHTHNFGYFKFGLYFCYGGSDGRADAYAYAYTFYSMENHKIQPNTRFFLHTHRKIHISKLQSKLIFKAFTLTNYQALTWDLRSKTGN